MNCLPGYRFNARVFKKIMILGVESSCDESAIALFDPSCGIRGEWIYRQIAFHEAYGGVVPDLASRKHLEYLPELLEKLPEVSSPKEVRAVAVTYGPGLAGCLALGVVSAKAIAWALGVPLVGVNHLRGHLFSPFIALHEEGPEQFTKRLEAYLPHLGLIVSGGNTLLVRINNNCQVDILAQTVDDASGEALDKGAKLLGMPYPGGPLIEKEAQGGDSRAFDFPRAFPGDTELKFSFSGLKTSLRYLLEKLNDTELELRKKDLCASYQQAVMDALVRKVGQVLEANSFRSFGVSGGVANNAILRAQLQALCHSAEVPLFLAQPKHTGDNAAMIAFAAFADPMHVVQDNDGSLTFCPALALL